MKPGDDTEGFQIALVMTDNDPRSVTDDSAHQVHGFLADPVRKIAGPDWPALDVQGEPDPGEAPNPPDPWLLVFAPNIRRRTP